MYYDAQDPRPLLRTHCQRFSRLGWALLAQMASMLLVQLAVTLAVRALAPALLRQPVFLWCLSVGSAYGVGVPAFCLALRGDPAPAAGPRRPLSPPGFGRALVILLGVIYLSNLLTLMLTHVIGQLRGEAVVNPVESLSAYPPVLTVLLGCVIAPLAEELLFRRLLLDRLRPYGDRFAILASALCFGLFHGNLNQYFYAFATGSVLAYVMVRTGCLWQTVLLHLLVNGTSVVLVPLLRELGLAGDTLISLLVLGSMVAGLALLVSGWRDLRLGPGVVPLSEGWKWRLFFENPGVLCFCLLSLLLAATYLV